MKLKNREYVLIYCFLILLFAIAPLFDWYNSGCYGGFMLEPKLECSQKAEERALGFFFLTLIFGAFGFWLMFIAREKDEK